MDIGLNERGQCDERWRRGDARHACSAQTQLENKRMRSGGRYEKRMFRMPLQRAFGGGGNGLITRRECMAG